MARCRERNKRCSTVPGGIKPLWSRCRERNRRCSTVPGVVEALYPPYQAWLFTVRTVNYSEYKLCVTVPGEETNSRELQHMQRFCRELLLTPRVPTGHPVIRLKCSSVHPVIHSTVHPVIRSSAFVHPFIRSSASRVHPVIRSSPQGFIRSSGHLLNRSSGHPIIRHFSSSHALSSKAAVELHVSWSTPVPLASVSIVTSR